MSTIQKQYEMAHYLYSELKLYPMAVPWGSKKPFKGSKWALKPHTEESLRSEFGNEERNIAVMGGEISNYAFFLDCDDKSKIQNALSSDIPYMKDFLTNTIKVKTARGIHYYYRAFKIIKTSKFDGGDVKGHGSFVLAPNSLHPNKIDYYEFLDEHNKILEIDIDDPKLKGFLNYFNIKPYVPNNNLYFQKSNLVSSIKPYGIPDNLWQLLKGNHPDKYNSRSEAEHTIVIYLVRNEWDFSEILELFDRYASQDTKYYEKKQKGYQRDWLYSSFQQAQSYLKENESETDKILNNLFNFSEKHPWKGTAGRTDQAVFQAILRIARRSNKLKNIGASIREVGELAGISHMTANRSLKRHQFLERSLSGKIATFNIAVQKCSIPLHYNIV